MHWPAVRRWLFVVGMALVATVSVATVRSRRAVRSRIDTLFSTATPRQERSPPRTGLTELPQPVRRYFDTVLDADRPPIEAVRLEQRGAFRLGDRTSPWKPLTATQHYTIDQPGFVWAASIRLLPVLPVRVVDSYIHGQGSLRAELLSVLPVADAQPTADLNEAALQRYLAETVWFPTALLPGEGVQWEAIDECSARATIEDHGTTASLVFHFDDEGLVERVTTAKRYRQEDDEYAPWTGYFEDYRWQDGVRIPTRASVEWNLPDGDLPYWRARIPSVAYR